MTKYQLERTVREIVEGKAVYTTNLVNKPTKDLRLAKSRLALECMRDERLGIAASYTIKEIEDSINAEAGKQHNID